MGFVGVVRGIIDLLYQKSSNAHEFQEYSSAHRNRRNILLLDLFLEGSLFIYHSPTHHSCYYTKEHGEKRISAGPTGLPRLFCSFVIISCG